MNIFDIGVEHVDESNWSENGRLVTFTAPDIVTNEQIANYLYNYAPMLDTLFMTDGNANTVIESALGEKTTIRFSRIVSEEYK